ncbi:MAG: GNAT family N-acetyltransferase [Candidatus Poribacteria bacterium]
MPDLITERLIVRPFRMDDVDAYLHVFAEGDAPGEANEPPAWFEWATRNPAALAGLGQPPYGDRAVVSRESDQLIGAVGFVPCLMPFEMLGNFPSEAERPKTVCSTPEFGLFYSFGVAFQRQGYATEAVRAMADYAFENLNLKRIIATTEYDNDRSIRMMERLGMSIARNDSGAPHYLQVVGVLRNPVLDAD